MIRKVWRGAILGEQACTKNLLGCNLNKSGHWLAATNLYQDKNDKRIFPNKMLRIWQHCPISLAWFSWSALMRLGKLDSILIESQKWDFAFEGAIENV